MKIIVQYSGGKDSQACLIWAVKQFGHKVIAVFCDTGWEHPDTYNHIETTTKDLGVELITLKSKKYDGMVDLAKKKKRFPSTMARFCTSELKSIPFIDYILGIKDNFLIIQGIRKDESLSRSKMSSDCRLFKYYFTSNGKDKKGKDKFHTYRKKEVIEWCKNYDDSIIRPIFLWGGQDVINYIIANGQKPNPLYYKGAIRVGCFPCIMSSKKELKAMIELTPEWIDKVNQAEIEVGSSFFPPTYIPKVFCTKVDDKGNKYPALSDVVNYLEDKNMNMFAETELYNNSCMSFYGICE